MGAISIAAPDASGAIRVHLGLHLARQLTQQLLDANLDPVHDSSDYQCWAHKTNPQHQLYYSGVKIDKLFASRHKRALKDYYAVRGAMGQRFLQADGGAVLWHSAPDQQSRLLTIWNFHLRKSAPLSGCSVLHDVTANGTVVPAQPAGSERFDLKPWHTYQCVCGGEAPCATHL